MPPSPILYAEDEEDDVFFMKWAFKQAAILNPLVIASDGKQAVDYLAGAGKFANRSDFPKPCLVLLDLNMPAKSGLEVLKWIRTQPAVSTLPVIVLSSSSLDVDIYQAYRQGANGYLVKPGGSGELLMMAKAIKDYWLTENRAPSVSGKPGGEQSASGVESGETVTKSS